MRPHTPIDVVWDGSRVYRVPTTGEIEAVQLLADGHDPTQASQLLGLSSKEGAHRRVLEAQTKLRALSPAGALYQMYRLQLVVNPRDERLDPVLNEEQRHILDVLTRLGLPYDAAHKNLGIGLTTLVRRVGEMKRTLIAANKTQLLRHAVARGDVQVEVPVQLWRGDI